jgi:hypothetical protein
VDNEAVDDEETAELSFQEAMLSDIAEDMAKVRRNTSFLAGVLLVYLVIVALAFVLAIVGNVVVTRS